MNRRNLLSAASKVKAWKKELHLFCLIERMALDEEVSFGLRCLPEHTRLQLFFFSDELYEYVVKI